MSNNNTHYTHIGFINKNLSTSEAITFNKIENYSQQVMGAFIVTDISFLVSDLDLILDKRSNAVMFLLDLNGEIFYHQILGIKHKTLGRSESGALITLQVVTPNTTAIKASSNFTSLCLPQYTFAIMGGKFTHWDFINYRHLDNQEDTETASDSLTPGTPLLQQDYSFRLFNVLPELDINFPVTRIRFAKGSSPYTI